MTKIINNLTRSVKLYLTLLVISTAVIIYGTLFPIDYEVPKTISGFDKAVHFIMFGSWTFFFGLVRFLNKKFKLLTVFLIGSLFGMIIEFLQYALPINRSPELLDLVADISGTGAAILILYALSKKTDVFNNETAS